MDTRWSDLAGADAVRAYDTVRRLAGAPAAAVPYLAAHLTPALAADARRLARLVADLDSSSFPMRQSAWKELEGLGEPAVGACRKALAETNSLEVRRRLESFLEAQEQAWRTPEGERVRALRAVEVLEHAGTAEAKRLLERLAHGAEGARLTQEAKAARQRLEESPARP